jgi:broad specificity phosphatase PhoE
MPDWSVPLTNTGMIQASQVSNEIIDHLDHWSFGYKTLFVNSSYVRARETANIIDKNLSNAGHQYKRIETPLIREREWGKLREEYESFKTREERNHLFDFYRRPIDGESFADCYQRAWNFLNWLKTQDTDAALIVSHREFIKTMLMIIDNVKVEDFDSIPRIKNCGLIVTEI